MKTTFAHLSRFLVVAGCLALAGFFLSPGGANRAAEETRPATPAIDFARHIRPILSENCFACHGPDEKQRKAKLRLDTKEGAFTKLRAGNFAIVPGKPAESELLTRIASQDAGHVMPPPKSNKKLKPEQIALVKAWIEQGAPWSEHWAFVAPKKPALPDVKDATWVRNEIDRFILARLEKEGLSPSAEADKTTLIRRVTFDLTGLPPTLAEVDAFLADNSPDAYEKVVDRLLQSSRYGEHMARYWLDDARYGDTHGLHLDNYREIWPYREWVIKAYNANKPFDRFLIEQLAGDLLPNPTTDQLVATGYNRCHVTTSEGGSIEEEVYVRNVVDQVDTNGTVFMGLAVGCARCHDHKYDPIRQKDYYQLFAFFNSIDGRPLDGNAPLPAPVVKVPSAEQAVALEKLEKKIASLREKVTAESLKVPYDGSVDAGQSEVVARGDHVWFDDELPPRAKTAVDNGLNIPWKVVGKPDHPVYSGEKCWHMDATDLKQFVFNEAQPIKIGEGDVLFAHVFLDPLKPPKEIMLQWHTDKTWRSRAFWGQNVIEFGKNGTPERFAAGPLPKTGAWVRIEVEAAKVGLKPGTVVDGMAFTQFGGSVWWDRAGIETWTPQEGQTFDTMTAWIRSLKAGAITTLPADLQATVKLDRGKRTEVQTKQLRDYFLQRAYSRTRTILAPIYAEITAAEKERAEIEKAMPATLIFKEMAQPKPAYMLKRGEYEQKGEQVGRDTPAFLPPFPTNAPRNRLGFAQWLVSPEHPLTARVAVNRLWQQVFGTGIVKTTEDFGSQGEPPSHFKLLDWLAVQFREDGWDVKKTMKRIVMSATYRQSSKVTKDRLAKDPANRLLARGPRFRLDAEMLRDQALFTSGLLVEKIGGPSVKPPQPAGLWEAVGYTASNTAKFVPDTGHEKVHRRSMYTFWKRTSAPPQMTAFDAPSRESCTVRRERTNTPLQALLLLNETQFVECARALGERAMKEGGQTPEARVTFMFRVVTARKPDAKELAVVLGAYQDQLTNYTKKPEAAKKLIATGETKPDAHLDPVELAAWTMTANLLLNLDEVLNKG